MTEWSQRSRKFGQSWGLQSDDVFPLAGTGKHHCMARSRSNSGEMSIARLAEIELELAELEKMLGHASCTRYGARGLSGDEGAYGEDRTDVAKGR